MNITILQRKETITTKTLRETLEKRGHQVTSLKELYFKTTNPAKFNTDKIDVLYYWYGAGTAGRICLCHHLDQKNIPVVNRAFFIEPYMVNKIYQTYKVSQNNIKTPETMIQVKASYQKIVDKLGSPFILKSAVSSCGEKVFLIKNKEEFTTTCKLLKKDELLYQKFIPNDGDYRIHVIGGKAVCGYKRTPNKEDFRANVSLGGSMEKISDEAFREKLFRIAEKVVSTFNGAEIIGVDLMQDINTKEIYFIETNELPGTKQVKEVTGVDISEAMVDYFEILVKENKKLNKKSGKPNFFKRIFTA